MMRKQQLNRGKTSFFHGAAGRCAVRVGLSLVLVGGLLVQGCEKNPASPDSGNPSTGSIEGYSSSGNGSLGKTSGTGDVTTVSVAEVKADGSLQTVSTAAVQAEASGYYKIDVNAVGKSNLVVIATQGTTTWKAVVASQVAQNATVKAPPTSVRSTVAANIYTRLVATGRAGLATMADIDAAVDADVAASVKDDDSASVRLCEAIAARAQAEAQVLVATNVALTQDQINAVMQAKIAANVAFDNELHAQFGNPQGTRAAADAYSDAMVRAYLDHGVDVDKCSAVQLVAVRAMSRWSVQLSSNARFMVEKNCARVKTRLFTQLAAAKLQLLGAAQAKIDAAVSAGVTLRANIDAAVEANDLATAFASFHATVMQSLSTTLSAYASAVVAVDAQITGNLGLRDQLRASVDAATTARDVMQAYLTYYIQVKSAVTAGMVGASSVQIDAVASLLGSINLY